MKIYRFKYVLFVLILCVLVGGAAAVHAQDSGIPQIPDCADVQIVGGGGYAFDNEKIYNGGGMDAFGTVYSAAGDLTITLKDIYITENLTVITLALGTSQSANNHVSSKAVYINGEQRAGGGGASESIGEQFERSVTLVFYGRMFDSNLGTNWDTFRVSFDGIILAAYEGTDSGYIGIPDGYSWSFVFHNPDISLYNNDEYAAAADERGIHTYGNQFEIELAAFSSDGDLNFDIIQKSDLLNVYGSQDAVWINDQQRGGGGNSVPFDGDGNPEVNENTNFVQTDHFLYPSGGEFIDPDSLAVWVQSVTFELTESGTPRTWTQTLSSDLFPMKLVQFYNVD